MQSVSTQVVPVQLNGGVTIVGKAKKPSLPSAIGATLGRHLAFCALSPAQLAALSRICEALLKSAYRFDNAVRHGVSSGERPINGRQEHLRLKITRLGDDPPLDVDIKI